MPLSRKAASPAEAICGPEAGRGAGHRFALRQAISGDRANLTRFWDVSGKRSYARCCAWRRACAAWRRTWRVVRPVLRRGIPLLMQRFPEYSTSTLKVANQSESRSFTEIEQEAHQTDHAIVGALMARTWGLAALGLRRDPAAPRLRHFHDPAVDPGVQRLVAMGLVAELRSSFARMNESLEWNKGGERARSACCC